MTAIALRRSGIFLGVMVAMFHAPQAPAVAFPDAHAVSANALQRDRRTVKNLLARSDVQTALRRLIVPGDMGKAGTKTSADGTAGTPRIGISTLPAGGMLGGIDLLVILLIAVLVILAL
ncbi:MAG: hypothetical protein M0037_07275 [Betaproteobacteria bacterium]|nr:hypothetical protein [Betaproteobacteria bacterium]